MDEQQDGAKLVEMTTEIVVAYVSHNQIATSDIPNLISEVGQKLATLGAEEETPPEPQPAVSVRRSVGKDHLICLVCGKQQKLLKRHIASAHDLSPDDYRQMFKLKDNYPMSAPSYTEMRSEMARRMGLGGKKAAPRRARRSAKRAT